ncbi:MAG: ABC transporter permease [Rhodothalassiaceae bacterium]
MWHRIRTLVIKEFLAVLRDKRSRLVLVGPPLFQLLIFALAATLDVKNVAIAILDKDGGPAAIELALRIAGAPAFSHIEMVHSEAELGEAIDRQEAIAAIHIDRRFSRDVLAGRPATVQVILDGRRSNAAQIVLGYIQTILSDFSDELAARRGLPRPAVTIARNWFNPNLIYSWFTVPGLVAILTMLIGFMVTALSVARERELGTFDQLLVSPLSPFEILVGKMLPATVIGIAEGSFMLVMAITVFAIPLTGHVLLLYFALFVFVLSVVGLGLFVSSLAMTQQQAILGGFVVLSPSVLLSGFATPVENMPSWLQTLTMANPLRHMIVISRGVFLKDMPFEAMLPSLWPMAVIGAVTLLAAGLLFRARLE